MLALGLVLVGVAVFLAFGRGGAVPVRVMVVAPASGPWGRRVGPLG